MLASTQIGHLYARTAVYRSLGTLRGAEMLLTRGIETATEQMYLLVRFVVEVLGRLSGTEGSRIRDPESWIFERIGESLQSWQHTASQLHDWHALFANSQGVLDWDPYREFAYLLEMRYSENVFRRAALGGSRGPTMGFILAVAEDFRERRLPAAVRGFDPIRGKGHEEAWLASVFHWFLLSRATADRSAREQLMLFGSFESAPLQPDEILEQFEDSRVAQNLHEALGALDTKYIDVLRRYFGLNGPEHTLQEIASRYGVSHHTARWFIVDALTALSVRLGAQGLLSKDEFDFAHLIFEKGMPPKIAARQLNVAEHVVRRSIQAKFHATLRKRTTGQRSDSLSPSLKKTRRQEISRDARKTHMNQEQIVAALWQLRNEPEIHNEGGKVLVRLGSGSAPLTDIRRLLARDEDLCDQLVDENIPLDWVFRHDAERVDIYPEADALIKEVENIAAREWDIAKFVLRACIENVGEKEAKQLGLAATTDEPLERMVATLQGLSVALFRTMDARTRQMRPSLSIWAENDKTYGEWTEGGIEKFDLSAFVLRQSMRFGEFQHDTATVVATTIIRLLSHGALPLPGFVPEKPARGRQLLRPLKKGGE